MKTFIVQQMSHHTKIEADSFEVVSGGLYVKDESGKPIAYFANIIFVVEKDPEQED